MKTELEDWKKEIEAQEMEIDAFQSKLEKLGAALEAVKQMDTGADGVYAETDIGKPVKPEKESE